MPQIVVLTDLPDQTQRAVLLKEHVDPEQLDRDDGLCARLVERVGWAIVDADEVEHVRSESRES